MRVYLILVLCMLLAACVPPANSRPTATEARPTTTPAPTLTPAATAQAAAPAGETVTAVQRYDVGGHALALYCAGSGSPVVVLEAGLGGDHASWGLVQPEIAAQTRVCSYDRAGLGASEAGQSARDSMQIATDLHALLEAAGEPPPYVLVGHSFGGLHVRVFAGRYPEEVAGMVLVDAVHEDWWERAAGLLPPERPGESARVANLRAYLAEEYRDPASNHERIDIPASIGQARAARLPEHLPLVVLTAGQFTVLAPGLPAELERALAQLFQEELQAALAGLSSNSVQAIVPDSGHGIPRENPRAVVAAIQAVLRSAR